MFINTTSRNAMEHDLAAFLDITRDELYQYISCAAEKARKDRWTFDTDVFDAEIDTLVHDLQPGETIDEVLCFHLSRRLDPAPADQKGYNLKQLLLTDNALVRYLREHSVAFQEQSGQITIQYKGKTISLADAASADGQYLRNRFGYVPGPADQCLNGFAMRDLLMKNPYARMLYAGPEFLTVLARFLDDRGILEDFTARSTYYCYTLRLPVDEIIFDGHETFDNEEKQSYLIDRISYRLYMYAGNDRGALHDHDNPIIRTADDAVLSEDQLIGREAITLDMLRDGT